MMKESNDVNYLIKIDWLTNKGKARNNEIDERLLEDSLHQGTNEN